MKLWIWFLISQSHYYVKRDLCAYSGILDDVIEIEWLMLAVRWKNNIKYRTTASYYMEI